LAGQCRELENAIGRAVVLGSSTTILLKTCEAFVLEIKQDPPGDQP